MTPFVFMTSVQSVQLTGRRAASLRELHEGLEAVDGSSIYHHTHRFYRAHSFLGPTPLSDFALWVGGNLREEVVAEGLAALDLRDYATVRDLRNALLGAAAVLRGVPDRWDRRVPPGLEFHFCRSVSLILPAGEEAYDLEDLTSALARVDTACLYHHLIEAPLHLEPGRKHRNDLSEWLDSSLGREDLARAVAALDPYRGDLEQLREDLLETLKPSRLRRIARRVLDKQGPAPGPVSAWVRRLRGRA
jgi:hypothetical protein